jgi:hypothetical protein
VASFRPTTTEAARYAIFGYRCRVFSSSAAAQRLLRRLYAPCHTIDSQGINHDDFFLHPRASGSGWQLHLGETLLNEEDSLGAILQQLEYQLCLRVMAQRPDLLALHAATVFTNGGRTAALITGFSGAGKTTLTLTLAARGYQVGGDDIVFIDPRTHEVAPLPRCFHLDEGTWRLVEAAGLPIPAEAISHRFLTPADLGSEKLHAAPLRYVFVTSRGPDPTPQLTPLPLAAVALALLPQLQCSSDAPTTAVTTVTQLLRSAEGYQLTSGELGPTVEAIARILGPAA